MARIDSRTSKKNWHGRIWVYHPHPFHSQRAGSREQGHVFRKCDDQEIDRDLHFGERDPSKLYQVDLAFLCSTFASTFGQFPVQGLISGDDCQSITRQGVTAGAVYAEVGVVTTHMNGDGSFSVVIGPVTAGTCDVEFRALDGAGCALTGGADNGPDCDADLQSPGPTFRDTTTITNP